MGEQSADVSHDSMKGDVKPAADGILGRVFPRLEAVAMAQIMGWFPVVEGLVTVLDGGEEGSNQVGSEKDVEGLDGFDRVGITNGSKDADISSSPNLSMLTRHEGRSIDSFS